MQTDGHAVLWSGGDFLWGSGTTQGVEVFMHGDGQFAVLDEGGNALCHGGAGGYGLDDGFHIYVDGPNERFVVRNDDGQIIWSSETGTCN